MQMLAEPALQLLGRQTTTYRGGWPQGYISSTCSGDAPVKCQPNSMYPLNCCPKGQSCSNGWPVHCCPDDGGDCSSVALRLPVCANSTWNMYKLQRTGWFCCPKDMVGIITPDEWTGFCQEKSPNIPATVLATVVAQFGASPATSAVNAPTNAFSPGKGGGSEDSTSVSPGGAGSNDDGNTGAVGGTTSPGDSSGGSGRGGFSAGSIAGTVIGSIAFLGLVVALILWLHRRSLRKNPPPGGMAVDNHDPSKPTGTMHQGYGGDAPEVVQYGAQPAPLPYGGNAPEAVQYSAHPVGAVPMVYSPHDTVSPQESAPAYSPIHGHGISEVNGASRAHGISEVNGVSRAEMDVPRSSNYY